MGIWLAPVGPKMLSLCLCASFRNMHWVIEEEQPRYVRPIRFLTPLGQPSINFSSPSSQGRRYALGNCCQRSLRSTEDSLSVNQWRVLGQPKHQTERTGCSPNLQSKIIGQLRVVHRPTEQTLQSTKATGVTTQTHFLTLNIDWPENWIKTPKISQNPGSLGWPRNTFGQTEGTRVTLVWSKSNHRHSPFSL